jgi:CRP-like cAMP-binding protein
LLAAAQPEVLGTLLPHLHYVNLRRGEVLYEPEDRMTYAYFPLTGIVSLIAVLDDGGSAEIAIFGCESIVACIPSLTDGEAYGRYIVQIPGWALKISFEHVQLAMRIHPSFRELLRTFSCVFLRQTFQCVACNACHPVEARCCRWILSMADRSSSDEVAITHEFLAEMLGVQRSTVSLIMRGLQSSGLIEQHRGSIRVLSRSRLRHCACECYDNIRKIYDERLPMTYRKAEAS